MTANVGEDTLEKAFRRVHDLDVSLQSCFLISEQAQVA
jgi:hypothetical protein